MHKLVLAICLIASQAYPVVCCCDSGSISDCQDMYSKLQDKCYDFTGPASDYFSVPDVHPRDGFFAVREASLYVFYQECSKITYAVDNYKQGQELEKDKLTGKSNNSNPASGGSPSPNAPSNPSSTPTSSTPTNLATSSTPSTPPTSTNNDPLNSNLTTSPSQNPPSSSPTTSPSPPSSSPP